MNAREPADEYPFLCVDEFLTTMVEARSVATALDLGLIDRLQEAGPVSREDLARDLDIEPRGFDLLLGLLAANRVAAETDAGIRLTAEFIRALDYRDLLETKIAFAAAVAVDCHDLFTELIARPGEFMARSRVFEIFRYDRATTETEENYLATAHWMRFTTGLTRYEAEACLRHYDFADHRRLLDIGGNSGEFALRICRAYPAIEASVFDLPVVCDVGRDHVKGEPEARRIAFHKGDVRRDALPGGADLVSFKSFLHDWPAEEVGGILARAADVLATGGTLMIFERAPVGLPRMPLPYSTIPGLLFFHFYRSADFYTDRLAALGFGDIDVRPIELELPFQLITARKRS